MAREFKLGPAMLRAEDSPHVPDIWLDSLLHKHLGRAGRSLFAQTSKAALNLLLSEWPQAILNVRVQAFAIEPPERLLRRMHAAQQQIAARGSKDTWLGIKQHGDIPAGDAWWLVVFSKLGHSGTLKALGLSLREIPSSLLQFIGQAMPGLPGLSLNPLEGHDSVVCLPHPSALPGLRSLWVSCKVQAESQAALWASVGPYLAQLTTLVVAPQNAAAHQTLITTLFTPAHTSQTLSNLALPCELTPQLARLLQQHAPALQELTVAAISPVPIGFEAGQVAPVCSWRKLRCKQAESLPAAAWDWLPLPAEGKLVMVCPASSHPNVEVTLPLTDAVAHKVMGLQLLPKYQFKIMAGSTVQPTAQPAALQAALPILATVQQVGKEPTLHGFTMSAELAAVIAAAAGPDGAWSKPALLALTWPADAAVATPLPPLGTVELSNPFTDPVFSQVVQCVSQAEKLSVLRPKLQLPRPEGAVWPFRYLKTRASMELFDLVRQNQLLGEGVVWKLAKVNVTLHMAQVQAGAVERMVEQFSRLRIHSLTSINAVRSMPAAGADVPRLLRDSLTVIQAMPPTTKKVCVSLYAATGEVMRELRGLPTTCDSLGLFVSSCCSATQGPPSVWPLSRALLLVPRSYTKVTVASTQLRLAELEAFVLGAPADRTAEQPLEISVLGKSKAWADDMMSRMAQWGTYPHVKVVSRDV